MGLRRIPVGLLTFLLWLATAALGLVEIWIVREALTRGYARLADDYWVGVSVIDWGVVVLALVWIGLVIGGGEYHYRHAGEKASWRLFGWTVAVEVAILVLALII